MNKNEWNKIFNEGYVNAANVALNCLYWEDKRYIEKLATVLDVTHDEMIKYEMLNRDFEEAISKNSRYWK